MRSINKTVVFMIMLFLLLILCGLTEFILILFHPSKSLYAYDELLGWRLKPNISRIFTQRTLEGEEYEVAFSTNQYGLRTFGKNENASLRILILGDSNTVDPFASNDRMWYRVMASKIDRSIDDVFIWAGGGSGYGTYQNLLLATSLKTIINPNFFVLQFCSNDFSNNHLVWEAESIVWSQSMRRPYWDRERNRATYRSHFLSVIYRSSFLGQSRVFNIADNVVQRILYNWYGGYSREIAGAETDRYIRESISLTRDLLIRLRSEFGQIPAIMINCSGDTSSAPNDSWITLARDAGFVPIAEPSDRLLSAELTQERGIFHADGGHLSEKGNYIFGEELARGLITKNLLP